MMRLACKRLNPGLFRLQNFVQDMYGKTDEDHQELW
jgi:hypothetical protein